MNIHPDTPLHIHREDCWPPSRAKSSAEGQGCKRTVRESVKPDPHTPLQASVPVQVTLCNFSETLHRDCANYSNCWYQHPPHLISPVSFSALAANLHRE